jgi:hypothetical protein
MGCSLSPGIFACSLAQQLGAKSDDGNELLCLDCAWPDDLRGIASLGVWSLQKAAFVAAIYVPATLALALCYWIGLRGTPIGRWTKRLGIATVWLLCVGVNLWILGHYT